MGPSDLPYWSVVSLSIRIGKEYPLNVSSSLCESPSIAKTLIVLSDEQVARRFP